MFLRKDQKRKIDVKAVEERVRSEDSLKLEKGDLLAIFIAAISVFAPFLLAMIATLLFAYWLIAGRFA